MNEAEDDFTLIPSDLDMERLQAITVDGRVEAENQTWVVLRYPVKPKKGWNWCEYSLIVNCPNLPPHTGTHELKTINALIGFLHQLEVQRKTST